MATFAPSAAAFVAWTAAAMAAPNPCQLGAEAPVVSSPATPSEPTVANNANFDCMMWQSFITLNWPALAGSPGTPDPSKPLGTPGPRVWETFDDVDQVFAPQAGAALAVRRAMLTARSGSPDAAAIRSGALRLLTQTSKLSPVLLQRRNPNRLMLREASGPLAAGTTLTEIEQADGGVLIDQNGQNVYYEELLNPTEVSYITSNGLADAGAQNKFAESNTITLPVGSVEVKAAWKVIGSGDTPAHFITSQALIDGSGTPVTVGLVGLHIMHRVSDLNQGVWATFAQTENAPYAAASGHYSFNDPALPQSRCPTIAMTTAPTPTQLVQCFPVDASAVSVNAYVAGLVATVPTASAFAYYQLLNVQWPQSSTPLPPAPQTSPLPTGSPNTMTLMNPVLETFLQQSQVSCLSSSCHAGAMTAQPPPGVLGPYPAGYSFLFSHAQAASPPAGGD